jgi:hypothetical protein
MTITLEIKSILARWTISGYRMSDNNDINDIPVEPVSTKINISRLGPWYYAYQYFPEDYLYEVLFGAMICINYWHVIKIVIVFLEKISILCWRPA